MAKARRTFWQIWDGLTPGIEDVTNELDGDTLKTLDPYLKIEAMSFAVCHTTFGSIITRRKLEGWMPTADATPMRMEELLAETKKFRELPANKWLGPGCQSDCQVVIEALTLISHHDATATKALTGQWAKSIADRLAFFCQCELPSEKEEKKGLFPKKVASKGRPSAETLFRHAQAASNNGDTDADSIKALLPFQCFLTSESYQAFLHIVSDYRKTTGAASSSSSGPPSKKHKQVAADPHAATWSLFRQS